MKIRILFLILMAGLLVSGPSHANNVAPFTLLVLGDSLVAGYGIQKSEAFPARLEAALRDRGHDVRVLNAGVSGDTSAGGLSRLEWALADRPDLVIVELGANDALRGLDPEKTRENLAGIIERLHKEKIKVLLAGMKAPRNLGPTYYSRFDPIYSRLANEFGVVLYPFFLEGVATRPELNLDDGMHPNPAGVEVMVRNILPTLEPMLP